MTIQPFTKLFDSQGKSNSGWKEGSRSFLKPVIIWDRKMFYTIFWKLGDSVFTSKKFHQVMSVGFKIINRLAFHLPSNKANNNFQAKYLCKIYLHLVLGSTWHKETTWVLRNCYILDCLYIHCLRSTHQHWLRKVFQQSIYSRYFEHLKLLEIQNFSLH